MPNKYNYNRRNILIERQIRRLYLYLSLLKDAYELYKSFHDFKEKGEKRLFKEVEFIYNILTKDYYSNSEKKTLIQFENRYQNCLKA